MESRTKHASVPLDVPTETARMLLPSKICLNRRRRSLVTGAQETNISRPWYPPVDQYAPNLSAFLDPISLMGCYP
jgi:hypothetical protein